MTKKLSFLFLLAFLASSCGLGTEVGNGARDKEKEGKKTSQSQSGTETENSQENDQGGGDNLDSGELPPAEYGFDISILLNSCASPFEKSYGGSINLGTSVKGQLRRLSGTYDDEAGSWTLKDNSGKHLATITDDETSNDFAVMVKDSKDEELASDWTCGEIEEEATATGYLYNVDLTKDNKTARLSWAVHRGSSGSNESLEWIEVTPDSTSNTAIKFEK